MVRCMAGALSISAKGAPLAVNRIWVEVRNRSGVMSLPKMSRNAFSLRPVNNPPQSLLRGKVALSITATFSPCFLAVRAAALPAGPDPMTITSNNVPKARILLVSPLEVLQFQYSLG